MLDRSLTVAALLGGTKLRGGALGSKFPFLIHHRELQLQLVTGDGAFVFRLHWAVLRFTLYGKGNIVSLDLAVGDFDRCRRTAAATAAGHCASQLGAIGLKD